MRPTGGAGPRVCDGWMTLPSRVREAPRAASLARNANVHVFVNDMTIILQAILARDRPGERVQRHRRGVGKNQPERSPL